MGYRFIKSKDFGPLRLHISSAGIDWTVSRTIPLPAAAVSRISPAQDARPAEADPDTARNSEIKPTLLCILAGILIGAAILFGMFLTKTLPGYTRENMIPPPPESAQTQTEVTP